MEIIKFSKTYLKETNILFDCRKIDTKAKQTKHYQETTAYNVFGTEI
jgi:hypothetical protein